MDAPYRILGAAVQRLGLLLLGFVLLSPLQAQNLGFTLDFERGTLQGWQASGNAFDHQPTRDDNPTARNRGQPSNHQGRYWIGTYERFQGKSGERPGAVQGDKPTGTLTSPVFTLPDGSLSFLVGGGSSSDTRVELLIIEGTEEFNERRVYQASGRNSETMHRVSWDLARYAGRKARLRIVDAISDGWGHINVDDFRFGSRTADLPTLSRPPVQVTPDFNLARPPEVRLITVPYLIDKPREQALAIIHKAGLETGEISERPSDRAADTVLEQDPKPRSKVKPGSRVNLWVAVPRLIEVPQLVGRDVDLAMEMLGSSELTTGERYKQSSSRPEGTVVRQRPSAGALVKKGSPVEVWVAVTERVEVPGMVKDSRSTAERKLRKAGLKPGRIEHIPSPQVVDTVLDHDPPAGALVPVGSAVALTLAEPMLVTVPDLDGLTRAEAETRLGGTDLKPGAIEGRISDRPAGTVIGQQPKAGSRLPVDSRVRFWLAETERVATPELTGLSLEAAERTLLDARLQLGEITQRESERRPGTVLSQQPRAGQKVAVGSRVAVVEATPLLVTVPDLMGLSRATARRRIEKAGLVGGPTQDRESTQTPGSVLGQHPQAGSRVARGSEVTLILAVAAQPVGVIVPSVSGLSSEQARDVLADADLLLGSLRERESGLAPGRVLEQRPTAGSRVAAGSAVDIVIAVAPLIPIPEPAIPMWVWLGGGFVAVGAGALALRRLRPRRSMSMGDTGLRVEPHPDAGKQRQPGTDIGFAGPALRLRPHADPGEVQLSSAQPTVQQEGDDHAP